MNPTQITTTAAPLIAFLAGLAAGKGLFGLDIATWTTLIGGLVGFGATVWAAISTRKSAIISQAASLPEVQSVKLEPTAAGTAMADSTPANVTVAPR